jgi:nitroreductase
LLSTTRSVRKRLDLQRPVEPEVILDCIRLAQQAPTGGNSQTWRWVVVTDADKRAALADLYRDAALDNLRAQAARTDVPDQTHRVYDSAVYLAEILEQVPVHVIPCIQGRVDGADNARAAGFYSSILPAAWSFSLALRSRGLGSAWTTAHLAREEQAAELLGIPADVSQTALLPVAYTIGTNFKPANRGPAEDVTYWNEWRQ